MIHTITPDADVNRACFRWHRRRINRAELARIVGQAINQGRLTDRAQLSAIMHTTCLMYGSRVSLNKFPDTELGHWRQIVATLPVPEWELTARRGQDAAGPYEGGLSRNDLRTLALEFNRRASSAR